MILIGLFIVLPITALIWLIMRLRGLRPRLTFEALHDRVGNLIVFGLGGLFVLMLLGSVVAGVIVSVGFFLGFWPLPK
jgi:hypothetical protein